MGWRVVVVEGQAVEGKGASKEIHLGVDQHWNSDHR